MKHLNLTLMALLLSFASFAIAPITGVPSVCVGSSTPLGDITPAGIWTVSNAAIATINVSGSLTGLAGGMDTVYYIQGGDTAAQVITVNVTPDPIVGPSAVCVGATVTETDDIAGGTWISSSTGTATIDPSSGIVSGLVTGTTTITYGLGSGCSVSAVVSVSATPAGLITGVPTVCPGLTTSLTDAGGGTWSSDNTGVASVDPTGVVSGESPGAANITYTLTTGCSYTTGVTVNSVPYSGYSVTGGGTSCGGTTGVDIGLDGSTPGVSYQLYNGAATVGAAISGSGTTLDFGLFTTGGAYTVIATNGSGCSSNMGGGATVIAAPAPTIYNVTGGGTLCAGGTGFAVHLSLSDIGINYQLYNGASPVGAAVAGTGVTLNFGTITTAGTYTVIATDGSTGCTSNMTGSAVITVHPLPALFTVSGGGNYCSGTSGLDILLSGSATGINYQLFDGAVSASGPTAGTGSGLDFGLHTAGTYTVVATNATTTCTQTMTGSAIVVATLLTPSVGIVIAPGGPICTGSTISFGASPVNGGTPTYTWSVNGTVAGTGSTHVYVPSNGDVVSVVMTSSLPCASPLTATTSSTLHVITPAITATSILACGGPDSLFASGGQTYTWSPAAGLSCTTCDTVTVSPTATVTYTLTGIDDSGCVGTTVISANGNRISGHISGVTTSGASIRVWLIQFNPIDSSLTATDSVMTCMAGTTPYYEFDNVPAGNYVVKANVQGGTPGISGYIPTYGLSSPYWVASTGIIHGAGTDTMHIDMLYGIVPPGPGFISGYIFAGAGKGTSTGAPAVGMLVYLKDAVLGTILTYTYTDNTGYYSFSGLAYSSFIVYPELFSYYTTPAYVITITPTAESFINVDFKQHNTYGTITPYIIPAIVTPVSSENGLNVYPNPTSGNLNIQWSNQQTGNAEVTVTDVVGRNVYQSAINMSAVSGQTQINLGSLKDGIYLINIKSASINYSGKLMIQQ